MSLLLLFPRRGDLPTLGGSSLRRYGGYSSGKFLDYSYLNIPTAKKRARKTKPVNRDTLVRAKSFKQVIKRIAKAKVPSELAEDYALGSNEIIESWQALLRPQSLEALQEALKSLGTATEVEAETIVEIVAPEVYEEIVEQEKPKSLEFSDDELLLAVDLMRDRLKPKPKLEFTDEELLLAAFLIKHKRNKK